MPEPVVIVHGGAGSFPDNLLQAARDGTKAAARAGYAILKQNGTALDAVQEAVRILEDDPTFNAGKGSVLTSNGDIEMDAVLMDGKMLNSGGVACVQNIKNPIELARKVLEKTDHILLVGPGANQFAEEVGIERVPRESLLTEKAIRQLDSYKASRSSVNQLKNRDSDHDTVGAVAIDAEGNVAYGTSTGGMSGKKPGRVGDSPIIGAGGYADNEVGGVSCTGHGESISKVVLAYHIITLMRQGIPAQEAAVKALENMAKRVHGYGGVIVLSNTGDCVTSFTTERMSWAYVKEEVVHHGVSHGEHFTEDYTD